MPIVLLILPLIAALGALVLGRRRRAAAAVGLASVGVLLALLWYAGRLPADAATAGIGPALILTTRARGPLLLVYVLVGGLFALAWFRPLGRSLVVVGLAVLSPLAAALMITPVGVAPVMLAVAQALLAVVVYGGRFEAAGTAWRVFVLSVSGLLPLVWVAWAAGAGETGGEMIPLGLSLATLLLMGGLPFHIALRGLARWSSPGALALALGVAQIAVAVTLLGVLDLTPAVRAAPEFQTAMRGSALLAALLAAFLLGREHTWHGAIGATLILDTSWLALAALAPGAVGLAVALAGLLGRTLSLLLIALGLSLPEGDTGAGRWLRRALLGYGCLSLLGLPLTAGFAGRWAQMGLLSAWAWAPPVTLVALALAAWGLWRVARRPEGIPTTPYVSSAPGHGDRIAALVLLGLAALFGLFPGLLYGLATRLAG